MIRNRRNIIFFSILLVIILSTFVWTLNMNSNTNSIDTGASLVEEEPTYSNTVSISTNSIRFNTVDNLDQVAELIIVGTPTETFENRKHVITNYDDGAIQDFYTLTEIKIDKILKKPEEFSEEQETISIIEPVSLDGDTKLTSDGYVELQKGDQSIIFLMKNTFGDYSIINDNLGKFSLNHKENSVSRIQSESERQSIGDQSQQYEEFYSQIMEKYNLK